MITGNIFSKSAKLLAILVPTILAFSQITYAGGDVYQIYLNDKLILKEIVYKPSEASARQLQLTNADANDNLVVIYYHCGTIGTGRHLTLKDESGKIYKEWTFANDPAQKGMSIPVKELLSFGNAKGLVLCYEADQLQGKERSLASVNLNGKNDIKSKASSGMDFQLSPFGILAAGAIGLVFFRRKNGLV